LSIPDIAKNHERTEDSILYRLQEEGIIDDIGFDINVNLLQESSKNIKKNKKDNTNSNDYDNSFLSQRVVDLESSVSEMKTMVKQMVDEFMEQKRQKSNNRKPLRRLQRQNFLI
jgi:hypothetical protein